jgi:hypothetical protein
MRVQRLCNHHRLMYPNATLAKTAKDPAIHAIATQNAHDSDACRASAETDGIAGFGCIGADGTAPADAASELLS